MNTILTDPAKCSAAAGGCHPAAKFVGDAINQQTLSQSKKKIKY
jgi:hypothetical protein